MKLVKVEITNYRSLFRETAEGIFTLDLSDGMNALIGPNNCGKSNVLRAVALALDSSFQFDREHDKPAGMAWTSGRVTLEFRCDSQVSPEATLLKYAHNYEMSANSGSEESYAREGLVRLTVYFSAAGGATRHERLYARGAGARSGDQELLDKALRQFRKCHRFESGQSLESLLAGKFREILHTVIQEDLKSKLEAADRRRTGYIEGLQGEVLDPLRQRIKEVVCDLFPEVKDVSLVPQVSSIEQTLSNVGVNVTDAIETSLAAKGTGVRGAVMVAMLRYLADQSRRSMVFAIEEPEAFLHPGAQEELRDDLEALGQRKDVSVLITTHSPFVVSRDPKARIIALTKDPEGRTRISGQASGSDSHASLLGGLFRDAALPDILDRSARLPPTAEGVLVVEGITDEAFLRLAASKQKRQDLLADIFISPADRAEKAVVQAVLMKQQTPKPILVLLDDDDTGRACFDNLVKRFGFAKGRQVMFYRDIGGQRPGGTEAEDLFPPDLMERFVQEKGEVRVVKSKVAIKDGGWRYDLNATGKESIPVWLEDRSTPGDFGLWLELIGEIRKRMGIAND